MKSAAIIEILVGLCVLVGGALACAWFGYDIAQSRSAKRLADQGAEISTLKDQLSLAKSVNQGNASQLTSLRKTLTAETERRLDIERAAQAELAARAARLVALQRAADKRLETLTQKAETDEDCDALRRLPVCAAVAERLWGDAPAAGTH